MFVAFDPKFIVLSDFESTKFHGYWVTLQRSVFRFEDIKDSWLHAATPKKRNQCNKDKIIKFAQTQKVD